MARWRAIVSAEVDYTCVDSYYYGAVRAHLARFKPNAQPISPYDLMLPAQALRLGAVVVTNNTAEFSRVPNLECEDWQAV